MNDLLRSIAPFFVSGMGLLFSVVGVLGLFSTFRTGGGGGPAGEPTSDSSAALKKRVHTALRITRIGGLFWLCLGAATLWHSDIRHSWFRPETWIWPTVGLFWAVGGAGTILSSSAGSAIAAARATWGSP